MGIHRNVIKLRLKLTPLVVPEWRKDEIDFYTPSPTTHNKEQYYSLRMTKKGNETYFLQLCDHAQTPD